MPPRRDPLTVEQLSARAGVSPRTWRTHRERGAPVPQGKTPREVERWLLAYHAWRLDNLAQQKHGNDDQDPEANEADAEVCPSCGGLTMVRRNGRLECVTCGAAAAQSNS